MGNIINTTDEKVLLEYQINLLLLGKRAQETGEISKFKLIREDDLFPYDGMWRINSSRTYREYAKSNIAGAIRDAKKYELLSSKRNLNVGFRVPIKPTEEEIKQVEESMDNSFGFVLEPTKYRSTKHFTINTPLEYTGSYNQVSSRRKYIVIDDMDNFLNSGYAYSMDYVDAYLDISHENMKVGENAIYLINEDDYQELINDPVMKLQLEGKRVVRYIGDASVAINILLTNEGVLPYKVNYQNNIELETMYSNLSPIFQSSMQELCQRNDIDYSKSHGNINGSGGHFSDLFDSLNRERTTFKEELTSFVKERIPGLNDINEIYSDINKVIEKVGYERLWQVIEEYNKSQGKELERIRLYDLEHDVDPEAHNLFIETLKLIKEFFKNNQEPTEELKNLIISFFHGRVEEQINSATRIKELLGSYHK